MGLQWPEVGQAEPHIHIREDKVDFLMVIMASGIARGCVRTTTTTTTVEATESHKMAAILHAALVYSLFL